MNTMAGSGSSVVGFDQGGLVFGVGMQSRFLRLYDLKNYENVGDYTYIIPFIPYSLNSILN